MRGVLLKRRRRRRGSGLCSRKSRPPLLPDLPMINYCWYWFMIINPHPVSIHLSPMSIPLYYLSISLPRPASYPPTPELPRCAVDQSPPSRPMAQSTSTSRTREAMTGSAPSEWYSRAFFLMMSKKLISRDHLFTCLCALSPLLFLNYLMDRCREPIAGVQKVPSLLSVIRETVQCHCYLGCNATMTIEDLEGHIKNQCPHTR